MIWLVLGFLLERAQLFATAEQYNNPYSGYGAVNDVINKKAYAPMAYRVLGPWILAPFKKHRLTVYEVLKWLSIALALWAVSLGWNQAVALTVAAMLAFTYWFDYWDWPFELAAVAFAMTGRIELAVLGMGLHALSKETFPLTAIAYWSVSGDIVNSLILLGIGAVIAGLVRLYQGRHEMYCSRVMIRENVKELMLLRNARPKIMSNQVVLLVVSLLIIMSVLTYPAGWLVPAMILPAGWLFAKAAEYRVFVVAFPWVAAWLLG